MNQIFDFQISHLKVSKVKIIDCFFNLISRSGTSSNASTPSTKKLDGDKPTTPISKSVTPTSGGSSGGSGGQGAAGVGLKPVVKPPALSQYPYHLAAMNGQYSKSSIPCFIQYLNLNFSKVHLVFYTGT